MRRLVVFLLVVLVLAGTISALTCALGENQKPHVLHTDELIAMVKSLQKRDSASYNRVFRMLKSMDKWTFLDEIGNRQVDEVNEYMYLRLNALARKSATERRNSKSGGSPGYFLDGRMDNYNICFIEKCLQAGKTVEYVLPERKRLETIAIVELQDGDLSVSIDGVKIVPEDCVFRAESRNENIKICITNHRDCVVSFVIINEHR